MEWRGSSTYREEATGHYLHGFVYSIPWTQNFLIWLGRRISMYDGGVSIFRERCCHYDKYRFRSSSTEGDYWRNYIFNVVKQNDRNIVRCVTSPVNKVSIAYHIKMGFEIEKGIRKLMVLN